MFSASFVAITTSLKFHRGPSCFARLLRPDGWEVCRWTETDFATFQDETTFDAREQFMGSFVAGCGWLRVIPLRKTTSSLQLGDEPKRGAVFFEGAVFRSLQRRSAPSDQRRAAASACGLLTLMITSFFGRDQQKFDDHAVVHLCRMQVTASSATMRVACLARRKVAFSFTHPQARRHSHLPPRRYNPHNLR